MPSQSSAGSVRRPMKRSTAKSHVSSTRYPRRTQDSPFQRIFSPPSLRAHSSDCSWRALAPTANRASAHSPGSPSPHLDEPRVAPLCARGPAPSHAASRSLHRRLRTQLPLPPLVSKVPRCHQGQNLRDRIGCPALQGISSGEFGPTPRSAPYATRWPSSWPALVVGMRFFGTSCCSSGIAPSPHCAAGAAQPKYSGTMSFHLKNAQATSKPSFAGTPGAPGVTASIEKTLYFS